jgi:hypothetical protein
MDSNPTPRAYLGVLYKKVKKQNNENSNNK